MISRRTAILSSLALGLADVARADVGVTTIKAADGRDVRVSIWPAAPPRQGVVLFSHGNLSAPEKYQNLLLPWSLAGFEVLAPLHVDSTDHPDHAHYLNSADTWAPRLLDMKAVSALVDAPHFISAGHSYGGLVALVLGGANGEIPPGLEPPLRDKRAAAVVAFSPPGAVPGKMTEAGYSGLAVPALIQTGDRDIPVGMPDARWQSHLLAYDKAPAGDDTYALVLEGVDHYYGGLICEPTKPGPKQEAQLARAIALSVAFMKAYGAGSASAEHELDEALSASLPVQFTRK